MLACAGFGDEFGFAHIFGEQSLAEGVIDLVCAAVKEVFAFEIYFEADVFAETFGVIKRRGPARVVFEKL